MFPERLSGAFAAVALLWAAAATAQTGVLLLRDLREETRQICVIAS
jgi:hypothetical protein